MDCVQYGWLRGWHLSVVKYLCSQINSKISEDQILKGEVKGTVFYFLCEDDILQSFPSLPPQLPPPPAPPQRCSVSEALALELQRFMCHTAVKPQGLKKIIEGREKVRPSVMRKKHEECAVHTWGCIFVLFLLSFSAMRPGQITVFVYKDVLRGQIVIFTPYVAFCAFGVICGKLSPQLLFLPNAAYSLVRVGSRGCLQNLEYLLQTNFDVAQTKHM